MNSPPISPRTCALGRVKCHARPAPFSPRTCALRCIATYDRGVQVRFLNGSKLGAIAVPWCFLGERRTML